MAFKNIVALEVKVGLLIGAFFLLGIAFIANCSDKARSEQNALAPSKAARWAHQIMGHDDFGVICSGVECSVYDRIGHHAYGLWCASNECYINEHQSR
jgi:hypothetical protein